ncbi:MAG: SpoIIIAH-like family protein [Clostridiales bacterium]|nr:SpoIIIAH-like family protein [Clostridiales bacterium]MBR4003717.1 SpoIIIAH-like family protein [Clostridia bacterium]
MLTKKKKVIILVSMLVLLVITGFLNIMLNTTTEEASSLSNSDYSSSSFFATCRADRTLTRTETMNYYEEILNNASSSQEAKNNAETQINSLIEAMTIEVTMEGLIKAKGFSEALVNYSSTYINVIIQSSELTEMEVAQIVEIIQSQVERDIDYIKIIPVE